MHADVVGSTTLVQKDESLAHERIWTAFQRLSTTTEIDSYDVSRSGARTCIVAVAKCLGRMAGQCHRLSDIRKRLYGLAKDTRYRKRQRITAPQVAHPSRSAFGH